MISKTVLAHLALAAAGLLMATVAGQRPAVGAENALGQASTQSHLGQDGTTVTGVLLRVVGSTLEISTQESDRAVTVETTENTTIVVNGQDAGLDELREGMIVAARVVPGEASQVATFVVGRSAAD